MHCRIPLQMEKTEYLKKQIKNLTNFIIDNFHYDPVSVVKIGRGYLKKKHQMKVRVCDCCKHQIILRDFRATYCTNCAEYLRKAKNAVYLKLYTRVRKLEEKIKEKKK